MTRHIKGFVRYLRNTKAISALEYAILLGVISVALVAALGAFVGDDDSSGIRKALATIAGNIQTASEKVGKSTTTTSSPTN